MTLKGVEVRDEMLIVELRDRVAQKIENTARPASIVFTEELVKTRSGGIMRRLPQDISEQRQLGGVTALANSGVVEEIPSRSLLATSAEDDS